MAKFRLTQITFASMLCAAPFGSSAWAQAALAIDSGSATANTGQNGAVYAADPGPSSQDYDYGQFANLCSSGNGSSSIAGTPNSKIYQTVRYGPNFSYSYTVPNGCYDLYVGFVECSYNYPGQRLTNVSVNGSNVISGLDVFREVGPAVADIKTIPGLNITSGSLNMSFASGVSGENAVVSAISLWPGNDCAKSQPIQHVLMIIFENANASDALNQPYMGGLVHNGYAAYLGNYHGVAHPSQPNYIALAGADTFGITDDNNHNINASHLGDLIEAKGLSWKVYAEDYPGNCFTGAQSGNYVRKHNPFISFTNVNTNTARCNAHIVNASQFFTDQQNGQLPTLAFYVPNLQNDGHDTSVSFADSWLSNTFGPLFSSDSFWATNPLVALTFDEDDVNNDTTNNQVYAALFSNNTNNGTVSEINYNHYSLLRLIEDTFGLGNLGRNDATAQPINDVFK